MRLSKYSSVGHCLQQPSPPFASAGVAMPSLDVQSSIDPVHVASVKHEAEFAALKIPWNTLANQSAVASVFLTHEWFSAAWAWRRLDSSLEVLLLSRSGTPTAILPLIRTRAKKGRARYLELLTVPDTQSCDMIVSSSTAHELGAALATALAGRKDWDVLKLGYLTPAGEVAQQLVPALSRLGCHVSTEDGGRNLFVPLNDRWEVYYSSRSRRLKKANNLASNRLHNAGAVRIDHLEPRSTSVEELNHALDAIIGISRCSWKKTTGNSLDQPGPQAFIRTLSAAARENGWLSMWLARVDGKPVAMEYQLIDRGNVHALRADFDASCTHLSPGAFLFRQIMEQLFGNGLRRYYMGPGENAYKQHWADEGEPLLRIFVYNRTCRGQITWLGNAIAKPLMRAIRDRLFAGTERRSGVISQ